MTDFGFFFNKSKAELISFDDLNGEVGCKIIIYLKFIDLYFIQL